MRLLAIGKAPRGAAEAEIFARYAARLKPVLALTEIAQAVGTPMEIKRREAESLMAHLAPADIVIALDQGGVAPDSLEFSALLTQWSASAKRLTFVIGGAEGLDAAILARAHATLSLGRLTWPHLLVRPLLAEQLFRAQSIAANHPYHRAGRP
jgi:23S rRNA (pseudouridine1915-N3)-methyltransferase